MSPEFVLVAAVMVALLTVVVFLLGVIWGQKHPAAAAQIVADASKVTKAV